MEVGQLGLKLDMVVVRARNVARAPGARAAFVEAGMHRLDYLGMLPHAEIVVRTPHGDRLRFVLDKSRRVRELAAVALDIGEDAVAPFFANIVQLLCEIGIEIHGNSPVYCSCFIVGHDGLVPPFPSG